MRSRFKDIEPTDMSWVDSGAARIVWSDGHTSEYSPALLRRICPCAVCTGAHGGPPKAFNVLTAKQAEGANRQIVIDAVEPMGHYAVAFHWGDGHREGIYSWAYLRGACPCAACASRQTSGEEPVR